MQQRRGTSTQWTSADPVLAAGEIGVETDTNQFKLGDGVSNWSDLSYFKNLEDLGSSLDDYILLTQKGAHNGVATLDNTGNIPSAQLGNIIAGAPAALDTLNEIATIIGNGSSLAGTLVGNIAQIDTTLNGLGSDVSTLTSEYNSLQSTVSTHTGTLSTYGVNIADGVTNLNSHKSTTTNVHGIADTSALATKSYADNKASDAQTGATSAASSALTAHNTATTSVHGISDTANLVYTSDSRLSNARTPSDASVTATKIASDAVTTVKILDANVTTAKIADTAVTTAKIADSAITSAKIADGTIVDADISSSAAISTSKVSGLDSALTAKAPVASPTFTGTPAAPTASSGTNTTQIATTAYVQTAITNLVNAAPGALDTLGEIATQLASDESAASALTTTVASKAPKASPSFTGGVTVDSSGIIFTDGTQTKEGVPSRTPIVQKTASYTLSALSERDSVIEIASGSAVTLTVPTNSTVAYPVGTSIDILQTGTGQITVAANAGVTINATPGLKLRTQWSGATLFKRATDTWVLYGDLSA